MKIVEYRILNIYSIEVCSNYFHQQEKKQGKKSRLCHKELVLDIGNPSAWGILYSKLTFALARIVLETACDKGERQQFQSSWKKEKKINRRTFFKKNNALFFSIVPLFFYASPYKNVNVLECRITSYLLDMTCLVKS